MSEESAKLRLPLIAAAQAQKHVTHNEALTLLDTLVQLSVKDKDLSTPPGAPSEGDCYIVKATGTGAWSGWDNRIVRYIDGTWRSYLPGAGSGAGWLAYVVDERTLYVFNGTAWIQLFLALAGGTLSGLLTVNGQIAFPATQNPSSNPNTLDDYEEGTFTPVLSAATTPPTGVTSSTAQGYYSKVGNLVFFSLRYQLTNKGTGGVGLAKINGLPFTSANDGINSVVATAQLGTVDWPSGYSQVVVSLNANDSGLFLQANGDNVAVPTLNWSDVADTSFFRIAGMYRANS